MNILGKEPAVILGAASEAIRQIVPALIVFGFLHWDGTKTAAFGIIVGGAVGFLNIALTRSQTTATPQVDALIKTAIAMPAGTGVEAVKTEQAAKDAQ